MSGTFRCVRSNGGLFFFTLSLSILILLRCMYVGTKIPLKINAYIVIDLDTRCHQYVVILSSSFLCFLISEEREGEIESC